MKTISPAFKDDTDKLIALGMVICSIFLSFIPSLLVVIFGKDRVSGCTHALAKAFFNFELLLFLIALAFIIPVIGLLLSFIVGPILIILNVVFVIINILAMAGNKEMKLPSIYEFI
ncbi:DUF4870 domain-containing protein [bacterium]|nr:DUF4870 domain-containing protein [bacterium]